MVTALSRGTLAIGQRKAAEVANRQGGGVSDSVELLVLSEANIITGRYMCCYSVLVFKLRSG
jgi:hypothetical protein